MNNRYQLNEYERMSDDELAALGRRLRADLTKAAPGIIKTSGNAVKSAVKGVLVGAGGYVGAHIAQNRDLWAKTLDKSGHKLEEIWHAIRYFHLHEAGIRIAETFGDTLLKGRKTAGFVVGGVAAIGATLYFGRQAAHDTAMEIANNANTALTHVERLQKERAEQKVQRDGPSHA